jgi:catechol 2,3-dioxygenase-like lactoylglutathione lyase family enzyme
MKMKLELVPIPVSDVDRAKAFYVEKVGFHADLDVRPHDTIRIVQLTAPGSTCSIVLSTGLPTLQMPPGSLRGLHLVVGDITSARSVLLERGVEMGYDNDSLLLRSPKRQGRENRQRQRSWPQT